MKRILLASLILPLAATASAPRSVGAGRPFSLCGYKLAWSDEFDDASIGDWRLEGRRWIAHTPWAGDFGDARFVNPGADSPFSIRDGKLEIAARRGKDGTWTSGLISAVDETGAGHGLREGYFETRLKMTAGAGTWPAFWLMTQKPRNDPRPGVEIDAMEYYGHDTAGYYASWKVHSAPGTKDQSANRGELRRIAIRPGAMTERYNTVGILLTRTAIVYLFNRVPVWRQPKPRELDTPMFPLVNLALGSGYSIAKTPNPSVLSVDYVRLYAPAATEREGAASPRNDRGRQTASPPIC